MSIEPSLSTAGGPDDACQRVLDALTSLSRGRPSPWVSIGEVHRHLGMPMYELEPLLRYLQVRTRILVVHHNATARTSRYALLRSLGRSVRLAP